MATGWRKTVVPLFQDTHTWDGCSDLNVAPFAISSINVRPGPFSSLCLETPLISPILAVCEFCPVPPIYQAALSICHRMD